MKLWDCKMTYRERLYIVDQSFVRFDIVSTTGRNFYYLFR